MRTVVLVDDGEEVWFPHPANPCNLYFRVTVQNGELTVTARDCAWGPTNIDMRQAGTDVAVLSMPTPPKDRRSPV